MTVAISLFLPVNTINITNFPFSVALFHFPSDSPAQWRPRAATLGWSCLPGLMRSTWPEGISGSGGSHCFVNTLRDWHFHANLCVKERLGCGASYQIFHHREEEKRSYVAKTVDILVDCGEALPKVFRPLQHQISPLIRLNCKSSHVSLRWLCSAIGTFPKANNWLMTSEQKKKYHSSTATSLQGRLNHRLHQTLPFSRKSENPG